MRVPAAALALLLPVLASSARASTLHVPADYPTIQAAIDIAIDGDLVLVGPGTYPEHLDFKGKAIVVQSTDGASATTIAGDYLKTEPPLVAFTSGEGPSSILEGFTITNGDGRGILCDDSSPIIRGNLIR